MLENGVASPSLGAAHQFAPIDQQVKTTVPFKAKERAAMGTATLSGWAGSYCYSGTGKPRGESVVGMMVELIGPVLEERVVRR